MERTEEQKLMQEPLVVILGGKEYKIKPLVIKYSAEWRKKAIPLIEMLVGYTNLPEEERVKSVIELLKTKLDDVIESFFEYARELPKVEIENTTTDVEILFAFMEVFNAFVAPLSSTRRQVTVDSLSGQPSSS